MTKQFIIFIGLTLLLAIPVRAQDVTGAMLGFINAERAANGAPPLAYNSQLALAAQNHSNDMAQNNFLSHPGSDGSSIASRMRVAGYDPADFAENIAVQDSNDVFRAYEQWFGSEGHRNNMVSLRFTDVGVAMAVSETGDYYFTMVLGTATPALEDLIFVPTEEVVQPTEEVVQPTEEVVQPTEEVVQPTEEVVQPTEEVIQADVETPSEPSMERAFSATFTADPVPNTQVILGTGPFQPNPFTVIHFEVSYDGVVIATIEASPDVDGVARAPFVGTDQIGTYSVQAFLTSLTVTNQLISSGQFTIREEATEEVVQATEEVVQADVETPSEPSMERAFSATFTADPHPNTQVILSTGPFQPNPFTVIHFEVSYDGVVIATIEASPDVDGVARAPFVGTDQIGTYSVQAFLTSLTVTNQLISSGQFTIREEATEEVVAENGAIENEDQPLTSAFDGLNLQLALPDPAFTGSVIGMTIGAFPVDNIPYVQFIISYEGQAIAQIIGDVDDTGIATAEFLNTTVAGNYAVQVLYSDNIRETERSIFYPFVIVPEEIPQDTAPENDAPVVNEPQTGTFRSLDISAPFFDLVNAIRVEAGVRPLGYDGRLLSAAQQHNDDMLINGNFSHTGSDGSDVSQRVEQYNYQWGTVAENILVRSNLSVEGAFEQWVNSSGHLANMLNGDNVHMAVAYGQADDGSYYFTMVLGRPIDYVAPVAPVAPPEIAETVVETEETLPPAEEVVVEVEEAPEEETVDNAPEITMNLTLDSDTGEIQAQLDFLDEARNGETLVATISCAGEALGEVQLVQQSVSATFTASPRFVFTGNVGCELEVSVAYTTERDNTLVAATAIVEPLTFTPYIGLAYAELAESIVVRGDILEMIIRDLAPNETISMVLESGDDPDTATRFNLERVTADENGVANWSVTIPQAVLDGTLLVLGSNRTGVIINEQVLVEPSPEDIVAEEDDEIPDGNNLTLQMQLNNLTGRIQVSVLGFAPDDEEDADIIISVICDGQLVRQYAGMKDNGEIDIEELYDWSLFVDYAGCQATFTVAYTEAPDVVIAQTDTLINQPNFMQGTHITVEPQIVVAGETITVTVTDHLGNMSRIAVSYILNEIYGENVESDENGNFVWTTTIPEDIVAGDYNIITLTDTGEFLYGANFTIVAPAINVAEAPQAVAGEAPEEDLNLGITNNIELTLTPNRVTRGEFVDLVASNLTPGQLVSSQLLFGDEVVSESPPAPVDIDGFLRQHAEMLETDPLGEYVLILLDENELPIAVGSFHLVADNEVVQTDETGNTNANTEVGNTEGANTNTGNTGNAELPQPVAAVRNNTAQDAQAIEGVNVIVVTQPPRVDVIPTQAPANQFVMPIAPIDPSLPPPDIELHWNASSFTLFNISNRALDISELAFTSELGNLNIDRWDVDELSSELEVFENGGCLQTFLLSQSFLPEAPEFCQQRHGWLLVGEQNQFWNPLREFTVVLGQNQIAVCTISPCRIRLADDLVDDIPPVPESAPVTTGANVRLTYDETSFLIQNIADTPVILSGIVFQSDTVTFPISEWETEFMRADFFAFPSQDCLQTWDSNIFELPEPEACNFRQGWITVNQNEQFWLNTSDFTVMQFGETIATCSVSAGVCDIEVDQ